MVSSCSWFAGYSYTLLLSVSTLSQVNGKFHCAPVWGVTGKGYNNGNPRFRVMTDNCEADVAWVNKLVNEHHVQTVGTGALLHSVSYAHVHGLSC